MWEVCSSQETPGEDKYKEKGNKLKCLNKQHQNIKGNALWLNKQGATDIGEKKRKLTQRCLTSRKKFKSQLH